MEILNCTINDLEAIFSMYAMAQDFQKEKNAAVWPDFDKNLIETEIKENRQWKIIIDNQIACIWATTFFDEQIWEEKNINPSIYIHRIVTNPDFRGYKFVSEIVKWATKIAILHQKQYIRLDTLAVNTYLIDYYQKNGFEYLGDVVLKNPIGLPEHYVNAGISLFEIKIKNC